MNQFGRIFISAATRYATQAQHVWPEFAACEAALESNFGASLLAVQDNNLFGMKQHKHHVYGDHILPTNEFLNGEWITVDADFVHYPSWRECFQDRMATLLRLAAVYPHYARALDARDGETYVREVSETWSTDPKRGEKVLAIYAELGRPVTSEPPQGIEVPQLPQSYGETLL